MPVQRAVDGFPCVVLLIDVDKGGQPAVFKYGFEPVGGVWVKHMIFLSAQLLRFANAGMCVRGILLPLRHPEVLKRPVQIIIERFHDLIDVDCMIKKCDPVSEFGVGDRIFQVPALVF